MSKHQVEFHEIQRFSQWFIFMPLAVMLAFFILGLLVQLVEIEALSFLKTQTMPWLIGSLVLALVMGLFVSMQLETKADAEGVKVRFKPFHRNFRFYAWHQMAVCHVRKYRALLEYGGWGLRVGTQGWAFTTKGRFGLQLKLQNGDRLLIGTQKPDNLEKFLREKGKWKE